MMASAMRDSVMFAPSVLDLSVIWLLSLLDLRQILIFGRFVSCTVRSLINIEFVLGLYIKFIMDFNWMKRK